MRQLKDISLLQKWETIEGEGDESHQQLGVLSRETSLQF